MKTDEMGDVSGINFWAHTSEGRQPSHESSLESEVTCLMSDIHLNEASLFSMINTYALK